MVDPNAFNKLKFDVEVSTWYHEFRRGFLGAVVTGIRLISLLGSIVALLAVSGWVLSDDGVIATVAIISVLIGVVNLVDLVFHLDFKAREHSSLYREFKKLQEKMARGQADWSSHVAEWEAEAQAIRVNEPPTYWALYNICRNQVLEKYGRSEGYQRSVTAWQKAVRHFMRFQPHNFESV